MPLMPSSFLAAMTALIQDSALLPLYAFFRDADAALETTLPRLFFMSWAAVKPPEVFSLVPLSTTDLRYLPLAILLFFMAFIPFIAFMAFMAFMAFIANIAQDAEGSKVRRTQGWALAPL